MKKNSKFTGTAFHQGDTQWFELDALPEGVTRVEKQFIAKSERSGHAHALCGDYEMFTKEGVDGFFIKVGTDGCTLNHTGYANLTPEYWDRNAQLPVADHKPTVFKQGTYFVGIQRRKKHFSKTWEEVKD